MARAATMTGPFETEQEARDAARLAGVQFVAGQIRDTNLRMLLDTLNAAGVQLGAYDRRIVEWLAEYEPATCMVIASLIARAADDPEPDESPLARRDAYIGTWSGQDVTRRAE
jgi:hypothetical protein